MRYTASRLSEGNKTFPLEIHLTENSVEIRKPGIFSGESKYLNYEDITAMEIDSPMIGFSTITLYLNGNKIAVHGFSKSDAQEIRQQIDQARNLRKK
jgi:hypothetical protein